MWRLAWRNLWRNRTRTVITGTAIALTLTLRLVSVGLNASSYEKMLEGAEMSAGGAILVHGDGYWESRTSESVLRAADARQAALEKVDGVKVVVPRVIMPGLLSSATGNVGANVQGIVPAREQAVKDWSKYLERGTFLAGEEGTDEIVLGKATVERLNIELGDRVVLATTDPKGHATQGLFYLGGVLATGSKMTYKMLAFVKLSAAREVLELDDGLTQVGLVLDDRAKRNELKPSIVAAVAVAGAPAVEVMTWDEANPQMVKLIQSDREMNDGMSWIILFVVAFGIVNTFLMVVLERVRELGLVGALGMTPGQIARLVLWEGALLGVTFIAVGAALGGWAHYELATTGIDMTELMGEVEIGGVLMEDMHIRSRLVVGDWLTNCLAVFVIVLLSALYPAYKATRLQPAQAMRTYE